MTTHSTYHRDDLKTDLLRGGHTLVAAHGHESLSVRALAQHVNVSPGAPYHHFSDRRALLLALAIDGFKQLWDRSHKFQEGYSSADALIGLANEFLTFQAENPRLLELMYESELARPSIEPRLLQEQLRGFDLIREKISCSLPDLPETDTAGRAIAFWAGLYGFASLAGKGLLQPIAEQTGTQMSVWKSALVCQTVLAALAPPDDARLPGGVNAVGNLK